MTPAEFVAKWGKLQQKETALYAAHFDDVCRLVGHPTPTEYGARHDPTGERFSLQTTTVKAGGQKGFADVYFRDHFIWEYKGPHADLGRAYRQLQLYREALDNPPLLITSDIHAIHTGLAQVIAQELRLLRENEVYSAHGKVDSIRMVWWKVQPS